MYFWRYADYDVNAVRGVYIMGEEAKIIEYLRAYVKREGTAPSVRKFCRDQNMTPPAFYRRYVSMGKLLEKAGLPIDERTKQRFLISKKATRKHVRKAERKRAKVQTPAPTVESEKYEQQTPTFALIQEDLATKQEVHENLKERAQQFADEMKTLALNDDPEISGPIVDMLCFTVLPKVLEKEFGVSFTLEELCQAELTLRKVQEEWKKLEAKELQLDGYAKKVQADRERLKADSDKGALFRRVESLEVEKRVLTNQLNEAIRCYDNYRIVFSGFWATVFKCKACSARFLGYMESYPEANAWLLRGDWRKEKLKFLNSRLSHQT